jgi:hypothetical protein
MKQILLSLFVIACIANNRIDAHTWHQVATGNDIQTIKIIKS